jgi:hypothetical protein
VNPVCSAQSVPFQAQPTMQFPAVGCGGWGSPGRRANGTQRNAGRAAAVVLAAAAASSAMHKCPMSLDQRLAPQAWLAGLAACVHRASQVLGR